MAALRIFVSVALATTPLGMAAAANATAAVAVTLDQLKADPHAFAGRTIEVSGQLDECWNFTCHLCPHEATPIQPMWDRCLALSFDHFAGPAGGGGASGQMDAAFRYADVALTATFDPTCLEGICTDRASVLRDARVQQVTRRRISNEGLMHERDPLKPLADAAAAPIEQAFRVASPDDPPMPMQVFTVSSDPDATKEALVCVTQPGREAIWPDTFTGAMLARSTEDRYTCWMARKTASGWMLEPS